VVAHVVVASISCENCEVACGNYVYVVVLHMVPARGGRVRLIG